MGSALLDTAIEVCAIAKNYRLSTTATGIAQHLRRLLVESKMNRNVMATFAVDDVKDPTDFVSYLKKAAIISNFWITFSRPNPIDADDLFVKPTQRLLKEANGDKGKTAIKGRNLKADTLEPLARSAATTGDDAQAVLQNKPGAKKYRKRLKGNPVLISQGNLDGDNEKKGFLALLRETYQNIRRSLEGK